MSSILALDKIREFMTKTASTALLNAYPNVKINYDNSELDEDANTPYVHISDQPMSSSVSSLGSSQRRYSGDLVVSCVAPESSGTKTIKEYASVIDNFFTDKSFSILGAGYVHVRNHKYNYQQPYRSVAVVTITIQYIFDVNC